MKNEFALAFNEVLEEKQLPKEIIMAALESAMVSAYRRAVNASSAQHVAATIDPESGKVSIFAEKEVVEDIVDERTEVLLEEARKVDPNAEPGGMVVVETTPKDFGRVAAQTARQVIQQRIREAERSAQAQYFERQVGEIISGVVQATNNIQGVTIGLDMKAEGIMPSNQKIPSEKPRVHDRIRAIVLEVKDSPRGPQIILSRAHRNFLRRLLENEVPEIYHGVVEIRAIAREPGQRAKVAVSATQPGVDPVGACVGIKGVRIQAIVKELHDEKIDIIEWNPDPVIYISKAISPAKVSGVYLNDAGKTATVVVSEDQLSLAIGRDGQNARLAAKLTNWRIDIKSLAEAAADAIVKLQSDPSLANLAETEARHIPNIETILAKKSEGRAIMADELMSLTAFVDRVERRSVEQKRAELEAEEQRIAEARSTIPPAAFETDIDTLGLPDHVYTILTEAEYRTIGSLMLAMNLNPDKVLGLAGIGPKAMQAIEKALAAVTFPEPVAVVEVEPVQAEAAAPEATPLEAEAEAGKPEAVPAEGETVTAEASAQPASQDAAREAEEKPLDEIFAVRPDMLQPAPAAEEEEDASGKDGKKKKKGKKKSVEVVYDPDLDQTIAHKKHKRGDGEWEEEW